MSRHLDVATSRAEVGQRSPGANITALDPELCAAGTLVAGILSTLARDLRLRWRARRLRLERRRILQIAPQPPKVISTAALKAHRALSQPRSLDEPGVSSLGGGPVPAGVLATQACLSSSIGRTSTLHRHQGRDWLSRGGGGSLVGISLGTGNGQEFGRLPDLLPQLFFAGAGLRGEGQDTRRGMPFFQHPQGTAQLVAR